ncbi:peptidyl-prolyl cis-trans isomerase [Anaerocolumna xylanovorans]|uniref:PPIC-type PPIASE domain-containing protein n=1 Tax=Anaerocolumna xylanovorans DSM 12503 TaxID=1121345 RepID=A0A1M7YE74_9FIRM|nr:peptidylprolyl isomerase [Anaerocolumna xylanovorans]SHO50798.1 PPIC-type PPIASE domain-containing protein [Anaerocolumna xylanovorans DSM 12503]
MPVRRAIYTAVIIMTLVIMTGCEKNISYRNTVAFTMDDSKVYINEMMYHVLLARMQDEMYVSYMGNKSGTDEESAAVTESGTDNKELKKALKEAAIENAVRYQLFYELSKQKGYLLTEEEKEQCQERVKSILLNFGEEKLDSYGLDKESLTAIQEKITLASRYYADYLDGLDISKEKISKGMDKDSFRQYEISYLYGGKAEKEKISALLTRAQTEDFEDISKDTGIKAGKLTFLAGKGTFGEEEILEEKITAMKEGEVQGVIETVNGYYIIKLQKDSSEEAFENAVDEEFKKQRDAEAQKGYETLKAEHSIEFNKNLKKFITIEK